MLLSRALRSIAFQTHPNWQIILVNNGAAREELEAFLEREHASLLPRMRYIHLPQALGRGAALNAGLDVCEGDFVTVLDDDDSWHERYLEACVQALNLETGAAAAICRSRIVLEEWRDGELKLLESVSFNSRLRRLSLHSLARCNKFTIHALLYRRSILEEIGNYNSSLEALEDWEFNLRLFLRFRSVVVQEELAYYHKRPSASDITANSDMGEHTRSDRWIRRHYLRSLRSGGRERLFGLLLAYFGWQNRLTQWGRALLRKPRL